MDLAWNSFKSAPGQWIELQTDVVLRLNLQQREILGATEHLKCKLQIDESKVSDPLHSHVGWRTGPGFFREGCDWPAGTWLATPAGYALGHQVGHHTNRRPCLRLICWYHHKTKAYDPAPSATLFQQEGQAWMTAMRESGALLSAILFIAHPRLYAAGQESLRRVSGTKKIRSVLETWPAVFNKVQVISNRQSPFHRDTSGQPTWYDLLMTLGTYRWSTLAFRNLGMQVSYRPGTIALISAMLIHHGSPEVDPDRVCYSWFMSDDLHRNLDVPAVDWMLRSMYSP